MAVGDWTPAFEAELTNSTDASTTDDEINQRTVLIRERAKVEHNWGSVGLESGYSDDGRHCPGSARTFLDVTAPIKLQRPDNSAAQSNTPGSGSTLTGAKDQGRLFIDSASGEIWYYNSAGTWVRATALPSVLGMLLSGTSTDSTAIANGGTTTLGSWTTAISITPPAAGSYILNLRASIPLYNTSANDRYVRVDLQRTAPVPLILSAKEVVVRRRDVSGKNTFAWLEYYFRSGTVPAVAHTFEFVGEVDAGTDVHWGSAAAVLTGNGAANVRPSYTMWLEPAAFGTTPP